MRGQRSRLHQAVAVFLSTLVTTGTVPWTAFAAPPKPAAPAKPAAGKKPTGKPLKGDKGDDPKRAEARKAYAEAEAKFQSGDYAAAFDLYKTANDAVPAPQTLYKMAICLDKQDKTTEAITAYSAFLGSTPPASMDAKVSESQTRLNDLRKKAPVIIKVKSDPAGASVSVDGVAQTGAAPIDVKVAPGKHTIRVTSPGYDSYEKELTLDPGAPDTTLDATLLKSAPIAEATPPPVIETKPAEKAGEVPPEKHSNAAAFVVLGVAGAGAIVGGIFGVKALQGKSDFNNGAKTTDKADQVEKDALIADMALGAAITLGVTGTVLLLTSGGGDEKSAHASRTKFELTPVISPQRAGAAATLRF
jgi:PEGA domain